MTSPIVGIGSGEIAMDSKKNGEMTANKDMP